MNTPIETGSNIAATEATVASRFYGLVEKFERTASESDAALANIGEAIAGLLRELDINTSEAASELMVKPKALYLPLYNGIAAAHCHPDDLAKFEDANVVGKTMIQWFNFKTEEFAPMTKEDAKRRMPKRVKDVRKNILNRAYPAIPADRVNTDPSVKRAWELLETSKKLGTMNKPEARGYKETEVDALGGYDNIVAIQAKIEDVLKLIPKRIVVEAKAKMAK